ncbi:MAG TPA: hypothetical protein VG871_00150 [Vicinamibacterales bacterium]|jgi:hypothetical protein|nr:hypothetical protein [Vicinamibacterales bacterium]HVZ19434.1 hypothetical protein [Vicinamibacterales bacterium]
MKKKTTSPTAADYSRAIATLHELVAALDRRVPHVERVGEIGIAHDAAALRQDAMTRIAALTAAAEALRARESEHSDAVMTDDGGPARTSAKGKTRH